MEQEMAIKIQEMPAASAGLGIGMIIVWLAVYVFFAYCLARIAKNMGLPFGSSFVWAIIPIANIFLIIKLAAKPMWWFILLLIPIVNIVVAILLWMSIAEKLGKPSWWGVVIGLVPFVNLIFILMLAFGKPKSAATM